MRTLSLAVFLVVALQAMASASSAYASPTEQPAPMRAQAEPARVLAQESRSAAVLTRESDRSSQDRGPKVLVKDASTPKPVQIYWFFGGR